MKLLKLLTFICLVMLCNSTAKASHIVGGEMTYKCLGTTGNATRYEITLDIYQDCINGLPQAISEDNPAYFAIYDGNNALIGLDSVGIASSITVPTNFSNQCVTNPPRTCLRKTTFRFTRLLPNNATGYYIVYQRCCRNEAIKNIINPGETGATYFCNIPAVMGSSCNNSAVFKNYPPQIICINNPLVYDHSATDQDGDSLSYEFCETYVGGSINDVKPIIPSKAPFQQVRYAAGYSREKPMAGNPLIQINSQTGEITGTPNILGRYVVTVCCHEWRNGVLINTVKREFQFVVTDCSKAVVANMPQYSEEFNTYIVECKDFTVKFDNLSTGGDSYHWDFGVQNDQNDISTDFSPTYTYPDTGTYVVKLTVNKGSTCPDSIERLVKIYPSFYGYFNQIGTYCPNTPVFFFDSSLGSYYNATTWDWQFGDGFHSDEENPVHSYAVGGKYNVVLISKNTHGCTDTVRKTVDIERFIPFAGNDTFIVKGSSLLFNAQGGGTYTWTPSTNLSDPNTGNPVGTYPVSGIFPYNVHVISPQNQCEGDDSIYVNVVNQSSLFVPTGFTPNGDGLNDILKPITVGYGKMHHFRVFNRWGEEVFTTTDFNTGWNGYYKGYKAEVGVYFWVLKVTNRFGEEEIIKGDVTLIR